MRHHTEIKIRGYHLDAYGHVNNARWLELLEEARWRWLDEIVDLAAWDNAGLGIAVMTITVNYRRPASRHDVVEFQAWMSRIGGKGGTCSQEAYHRASGQLLLDAAVTFVLFDLGGGHARAFDDLSRAQLARYLEPA